MAKIFIDAGHGGPDPGAIGNGVIEENVNLDVARRLATELRNAGYDVMLYRSTPDENVLSNKNADLRNRAKMANDWGADYFISIHTNSSTSPALNGFETYVYNLGGEAERIAKAINSEVTNSLGNVDRGTRSANFAVLRRTNMPAVLVELGYLSNPTEALNLNSSAWRSAVSREIAEAIKKTVPLS